jgi:sugar/nucleoside kinase (ribokinase family)
MPGRDFEYVTVGHVTIDLLVVGEEVAADAGVQAPGAPPTEPVRQPGGGAFYSALQASRMGLRTLLLTRGEPRQLEALLEPYGEEIEVRIEPSRDTTTFATSGSGRDRRQRLLAWAGPMRDVRVDTEILHLAAVARETPAKWSGRAGFVGLTAQGLLRDWDSDGNLELARVAGTPLPERLDAVVISELELPAWTALATADRDARRGTRAGASSAESEAPLLAVTAGPGPTTVLLADRETVRIPTPRIAEPLDDLGAGDVFAAVLFISLRAGLSPAAAAARAGAAAALRVEGRGPSAVAERQAIEARRRPERAEPRSS